MAKPAGMQTVAGIRIPDSALARDAQAFAWEHSPAFLQRHCERSYVFGALATSAAGLETREELAYIAALLDASVGVDKREAERRLRVRLERQKNVLEREQPPRFTAIIDEGAVRRRVGGDEVIGDQIGYLVDMGRRPGIEIRIVPFEVGAHASGGLPFSIFGFGNPGGADSVVFQEARGDGFYLESPEEIERHRLSFERTRKSALSVEESRDYLKTLA
jgi:hypothetical protein